MQKRTPFTKGTAVSSSRVKVVWNLNFFFFIKKAMSEFPESEAPKAKKIKKKSGGSQKSPGFFFLSPHPLLKTPEPDPAQMVAEAAERMGS